MKLTSITGPDTLMRVIENKKGERVILDSSITISTVYVWFYVLINIGSLAGSIGMVYAEKYHGYWLAFLLPTVLLGMWPSALYNIYLLMRSSNLPLRFVGMQKFLQADASKRLRACQVLETLETCNQAKLVVESL